MSGGEATSEIQLLSTSRVSQQCLDSDITFVVINASLISTDYGKYDRSLSKIKEHFVLQ